MLKITDNKKLEYYIRKYNISDIFEKDMKEHMELLLFSKNEYICRIDEPLDYFYFLVEGKAKVFKLLKNGRSLVLQFYTPLKIIGDIEVVNTNPANSNIEVIEDVYCVGIPFDKLRKFAFDDSKFLKFICKILSDKLSKFSNDSSINLLYPLENRLASYILSNTVYNDSYDINNRIFKCNLTEVAEILGTSYRHLLRTINKLCSVNAIEKVKDYYEILNVPLLEKLAEELYDS